MFPEYKEHNMTLMNWYDMYSVNNEEIDNHHKRLFEIFNRLHDVSLGKSKDDSLESLVDELILYADYHFKAEEEYMRATDFKYIDKHIIEHEYFIFKVVDFKNKINNHEYGTANYIILFLGSWLLHHVIEEDKKIAI
jgi:hemerythrin